MYIYTHMSYAEVNCIMSFIEFNCIKHTHHVSVGATNSCATNQKAATYLWNSFKSKWILLNQIKKHNCKTQKVIFVGTL